MTVCTGSFIAALTDQFNGKRMTTHFSRYELFKQKFKNVILEEGKRIVDEGNIISAGGITSGIDLALYFIGQEFGKDIVQETANVLEYKFDYSSGTSILSSSGDVSK